MGKKKGPAMAPAFAACDDDDVDALRALIASEGADKVMAQKNRDGWTPLHQAAFAGASDCVALLLESGADVACKDNDGDTPAHYASAQGHPEVVEALLNSKKGGVRLFAITDNDGESVIDVALNAKTKRALEALEARFAKAAAEEGEDSEGGDDEEGEGEGEGEHEG